MSVKVLSPTLTTAFIFLFRLMCFGLLILGAIGSLVFFACSWFPSQDLPRFISLFASAMGALMAYAGWKGTRIRNLGDIEREVTGLADRRDRIEEWINK